LFYSVHWHGKHWCPLSGSRVCEAHTDEGSKERECLFAMRVGGIDVEPPVAEANPDGIAILTLASFFIVMLELLKVRRSVTRLFSRI
jgi:hypothetical protein